MSDPLGFLLTWTTYGSWLHGDERGWIKSGTPDIQAGNPLIKSDVLRKMCGEAVLLASEQRAIVERTIRDHSQHRGWELHAISVRSNHVHVVVSANIAPEQVMTQFKAWCSRRLKLDGQPRRWWTEHGSTRWLNDAGSLERAILYVNEYQ